MCFFCAQRFTGIPLCGRHCNYPHSADDKTVAEMGYLEQGCMVRKSLCWDLNLSLCGGHETAPDRCPATGSLGDQLFGCALKAVITSHGGHTSHGHLRPMTEYTRAAKADPFLLDTELLWWRILAGGLLDSLPKPSLGCKAHWGDSSTPSFPPSHAAGVASRADSSLSLSYLPPHFISDQGFPY